MFCMYAPKLTRSQYRPFFNGLAMWTAIEGRPYTRATGQTPLSRVLNGPSELGGARRLSRAPCQTLRSRMLREAGGEMQGASHEIPDTQRLT